jgi:ABC-type nitrate/sulfonate/bicarbonate transport system permease component
MGRAGRVATRVWLLPAVIIVWELATRDGQHAYLPAPSTIWRAVRTQWLSGPPDHLWLTAQATGDLLPSIARLLMGWVAAGAAGIVIGIALGRSALLSRFAEPIVHFGRAIPPPTLVPLFIVLFKVGTAMQLATITFGVIWPVLLNTLDGARFVDRQYIETARVFGLTGRQRLLRIVLPAAAPKIFAGLRLSLPLALILMVISEFVGSTDGIGRRLSISQQEFDIPSMWAVILLLGVIGLAANAAFLLVERRLLGWHHAQRARRSARSRHLDPRRQDV